MLTIPKNWQRAGLVLGRNSQGPGSKVLGDPCVVWDPEVNTWRMVLFMDPPGHGQAICVENEAGLPSRWQLLGPLEFSNPQALLGGATHKPFIVMDAHAPNHAAVMDGRYGLVTVSFQGGQKLIQRAWAKSLAGPWTLEPGALIPYSQGRGFDAKHTDAVSAYYFKEREEILYFYMGYPKLAQDRAVSPFGSAQAVAVQKLGEAKARKLGIILAPSQSEGHWASGWVGGLQLLPGKEHRWLGLVNASPSAPRPNDFSDSREEPAPSLGGFAFCDEEWPVRNWHWHPEPLEWMNDLPEEARLAGEGFNFWRQHLVLGQDGKLSLLYNSGAYGKEQIYGKLTRL